MKVSAMWQSRQLWSISLALSLLISAPTEVVAQEASAPVSAVSAEVPGFQITDVRFPDADFEVQCSKGTYIRSLAHEFGQKLNNGAYLTKLRRTQIGEHKLEDAWNLDELIQHIKENYSPEDVKDA